MSTGKLLLLLLVAAIFLIAAASAVCAVLGSQRGKTEQWARNGFVASTAVVLIVAVVWGAGWSISALNELGNVSADYAGESDLKTSAEFDATGERISGGAVPVVTPVPGTVIRETPEPEKITGVNYGADFDVDACNEYVYFIESTTVYTGPGTDYESIGSVTAGATVKRVGKIDGWSLINYNENYAFVSSESLRLIGQNALVANSRNCGSM